MAWELKPTTHVFQIFGQIKYLSFPGSAMLPYKDSAVTTEAVKQGFQTGWQTVKKIICKCFQIMLFLTMQ